MYSYIRGELVERNLDHVVIDVNGIGYMIYLSGLSMEQLPMIGSEIKVHTYLYLREDLMMLYGFLDRDELEMFKLLLGVSGIGPKGAMAILSTLSADDLRFAILSGDSKTISKAPGVGGKTAQRVVLELKDKMSLEDAFEKKLAHEGEAAGPKLDSTAKNDAIMALTALGYSSAESLKAVSKLEITENMDVEEILKAALKSMSLF
ncbi:MAG: Holliday junction branch migration protein RuvA [Lachnospiraceae bacterium]|nr:Holliday junction branch migration protein RuvA [Lachnospiraceae bacterium]MDD6505592.1 Holliday junction branch migration protein RuvA [Lachnospiraceae bacterium]